MSKMKTITSTSKISSLETFINKIFQAASNPHISKEMKKHILFFELYYQLGKFGQEDLPKLKKEHLSGDKFILVRRGKGKYTVKSEIEINDRAWKLIQILKSKNKDNPYLFDILSPEMTDIQIKNKVNNFCILVNRTLKELSTNLNFKEEINLIHAVHEIWYYKKFDQVTLLEHLQSPFQYPIKEILSGVIRTPKNIVITMHENPDPDAMGSSLGLYHFLIQFGHTVTVVSPTHWPDFLNWMPGINLVLDYENNLHKRKISKTIKNADWIFCLDFPKLSRLKNLAAIVKKSNAKRILIDHHQQPEVQDFHYGISHPSRSSASEMIYDFIEASNRLRKLNLNIAKCLYAGMVADTGSFRFPSTSKFVHRKVSYLMSTGLNHSEIHELLYDNLSKNELHFLGHILRNKIKTFYKDKIALITVPQSDLIKFKINNTGGLIYHAMSLKGIEMAAICIDQGSNAGIRLSFRSKGNFDVNAFAREYFEGGGHSKAAGGKSSDSLKKTVQRFIEAMKKNASQL